MISTSVAISVSLMLFTAGTLNPPDLQEIIQAGLEQAYIDNYDSAMLYFQAVIDSYPENPAGYFFSAALFQLRMMDGCHYDYEETYMSLLQQATDKADSILKTREDLWAHFYLGSCYTYRAVYEGLKRNYFETFTYGVKGGRILQHIIKKDNTFYDAYLGAGTYEYFWARAARYLPVLNIGGGDVADALSKIQIAAEHSLYSSPTAMNSLIFIYGEEKKYTFADSIVDKLLTRYPTARTFLWSKAELEFKQANYRPAADIYQLLHNMYLDQIPSNYANCAQCKLLAGKCYYELEENDIAREALKTVIAYKAYADRFPVIKEYGREAYGLLTRLY